MAQLAARGSHNPKVAGSIPVESTYLIPVSLGGQDTRLSPERPGFNSRTGNFLKKVFFFMEKQSLKYLTVKNTIVSTGACTVTFGSLWHT